MVEDEPSATLSGLSKRLQSEKLMDPRELILSSYLGGAWHSFVSESRPRDPHRALLFGTEYHWSSKPSRASDVLAAIYRLNTMKILPLE